MFYTYAHYRATDNSIFYIGKGSGKRAHELRQTQRSTHWSRVKEKHGVKVEILARWVVESDAFEHERFLIDTFRAMGAKLVNASTGGVGGSTGAVKSPEHRAKIGAAHKGRLVSSETLEKMRAAAIRQFSNPEARELARKNQLGKKQSEESSAKKSLALRGRKQTQEEIAARVKANAGFKHSEESLAKMRAIAFDKHLAALVRKQKLCLI